MANCTYWNGTSDLDGFWDTIHMRSLRLTSSPELAEGLARPLPSTALYWMRHRCCVGSKAG